MNNFLSSHPCPAKDCILHLVYVSWRRVPPQKNMRAGAALGPALRLALAICRIGDTRSLRFAGGGPEGRPYTDWRNKVIDADLAEVVINCGYPLPFCPCKWAVCRQGWH